MSKRERESRSGFLIRASLVASFPDDDNEPTLQLAKLNVEKTLVDGGWTGRKDASVVPGELSNRHKTQVIDA
ncbi:hypothetical protein [Corynebacterium parakroppenstedtii]|uniref:hypothetical protein n=1 Tax=Corynebacterium parakroppenstedtii TaxID=2828363 RepID=UPI0030EDEA6A